MQYRVAKLPRNMQGIFYCRGSALVIAIFVIIIMSLLGAALVKMMASSQESVVYEVLGTRAYAAAQTGVQWQLGELFPIGSSAKRCSAVNKVPPTISQAKGFNGCEIASPIECNDFSHQGIIYYTIKSIGQCDLDGESTSRIIEVEARSIQ
jgi:MSHA biogenesis protein MshP